MASGLLPMIAVDRRASQPLHRQIYNSFRAAILDGRLRPGQRIPSTRVFASEMGVSRFPVLNAYAQLLAEGYLQSRVGAGTIISGSLPEQLTSSRPMADGSAAERVGPRLVSNRCSLLPQKETLPWMSLCGPFRVGQVAFDQFPLQIWSGLIARRSGWPGRLAARLATAPALVGTGIRTAMRLVRDRRVGLLGGGAAEGAAHPKGGALPLGSQNVGDEGDLLGAGQRGALGLGG